MEGMCEAIAKLKFNPGECHYLENIDVQVRNSFLRIQKTSSDFVKFAADLDPGL